jgi:Excalibur calcium-binding domain/Protein of unknown function (DUF1524)
MARKDGGLRHKGLSAIGAVLLLGMISGVAGCGPGQEPVSTVATDPAAASAVADEAAAAAERADADRAAEQAAQEKAAADEAASNKAAADKAAADKAAADKAAADKAAADRAAAARNPAAGTALAAAAKLTVKGRAPKTGYTRSQFGQSWYDTDRNGCDTRNDMLRRDLKSRQMRNACKMLAGTLAPDPYTGMSIRFVYGGASEVDIDHVVALSDAWQKGAATWAAGKRLALANDPLNLLAVDASANRSKGDGDAATWLPPNKAFRCTYVARQVAVKGKYGLWVTAAERDAITRVLRACPLMRLPGPGSASTLAAVPRTASSPAPQPAPAPVAPAPPAGAVYYANCTAVRAAGAAPIRRGDPGYAPKLDRDGDGIGCE